MLIPGYAAALLIGVSLGLIGGGGSILTVPVLVYLFGVEPLRATGYSLFIVGVSSLAGAISNFRKGYIHLRTALLLGISSIATVIVVRRLLLPAIPEIWFTAGSVSVTKSSATMIVFAVLMLFASFSMIRTKVPAVANSDVSRLNAAGMARLTAYGVLIGMVTGFLGAGGGFLLIPALVFLVGLPMKNAIGTSLLIIAMNSLIGFAGDWGTYAIQWELLFTITSLAIAGITIGGILGRYIEGTKLKKGFGWFVLLTGVFIIARELLK
ncbi:MAG: sulfite exporter TauE/SafE family protein [Chitinophagaceae bacterium]